MIPCANVSRALASEFHACPRASAAVSLLKKPQHPPPAPSWFARCEKARGAPLADQAGSMAQCAHVAAGRGPHGQTKCRLFPGVARLRSAAIRMIARCPTATPSIAVISVCRSQHRLTRSLVCGEGKQPLVSMATSGTMMSCTSPPEQKFPPGSNTTASHHRMRSARKVSRSLAGSNVSGFCVLAGLDDRDVTSIRHRKC